MKSANEMRTITENAIKEVEAKRYKMAVETVEKKVAPNIELCARYGQDKTTMQIDAHIDIETVIQILVSNGYTVASSGNFLTIYWCF